MKKELLIKVSLPKECKGFRVKFELDYDGEELLSDLVFLPPKNDTLVSQSMSGILVVFNDQELLKQNFPSPVIEPNSS